MCMDVKYFYLNNHIDRSEYIMIQIYILPQEFVYKYNIKEELHNGYFFTWVTKVFMDTHKQEKYDMTP